MIATKRALKNLLAEMGLLVFAFRVFEMLKRITPRVLYNNALYRRRGAPDGWPLPSAHLRFLVAGTPDAHWFLRSGALAADAIQEALARQGMAINDLESILDFGCGCGRVLRHWSAHRGCRLYGTDYNQDLVTWCQTNLPFADVRRNGLSPPLVYSDASFDLIYALSVFTHLNKIRQEAWIAELTRMLKPGGFLVLTTHGRRYFHHLSKQERQEFETGKLVVKNQAVSGTNQCQAYHPIAFIRDDLANGLRMTEFVEGGAKGNPTQDLILLRKP